MSEERTYPQRPYLAVSAAIIRDGKVLVVRRARKPALGIYTLPGGGVETGETLMQAVTREVREETSLIVGPVALAGHREAIARDAQAASPPHRPTRAGFPANRYSTKNSMMRAGSIRQSCLACTPPRVWPKSSPRRSSGWPGRPDRAPCDCLRARAYQPAQWPDLAK